MEWDCNVIETFLGMPLDRKCNHFRGVQTTDIRVNVFR